MLSFALLRALLQQPTPPPAPTAPRPAASPIAKAVLQPAEAAVLVGDSLRLKVVAYDSLAGRSTPMSSVSWFATGGHFEGSVDSLGVVIGGSTGTITVTALVRPQRGRPGSHGTGPGDRATAAGRQVDHRARSRPASTPDSPWSWSARHTPPMTIGATTRSPGCRTGRLWLR